MRIIILVLLILISGCANMSEREKQTAWIVGSIIVTGAIISKSQKNETIIEQKCYAIEPPGFIYQVLCSGGRP